MVKEIELPEEKYVDLITDTNEKVKVNIFELAEISFNNKYTSINFRSIYSYSLVIDYCFLNEHLYNVEHFMNWLIIEGKNTDNSTIYNHKLNNLYRYIEDEFKDASDYEISLNFENGTVHFYVKEDLVFKYNMSDILETIARYLKYVYENYKNNIEKGENNE